MNFGQITSGLFEHILYNQALLLTTLSSIAQMKAKMENENIDKIKAEMTKKTDEKFKQLQEEFSKIVKELEKDKDLG